MSKLERVRDRLLEMEAPSGGPPFVEALRREARDAFAEQGLPTTRMEEWRYTSLLPLAELDLRAPSTAPEAAPAEGAQVLFVNGVRSDAADGAIPEGITVAGLADADPAMLEPRLGRIAPSKEHPFVALGTALLADAAVVTVAPGAETTDPLHLRFATAGDEARLCQPRMLVHAGARSRSTLVVDLASATDTSGFLRNAVIEVDVDEDAELRLVLVQRGQPEDVVLTHLAARQARGARLETHTLTLGGSLVRNDLQTVLEGEGAECRLNGLFLSAGAGLVDNHTLVDHAVPHGTSHELYKGVLAEQGRGVFRGRVLVRPDAQKTNASQSNPNLLLNDGAEIDTKPQLEIHADDVRCSHGSAIGRLDPDSLFYLRARGLDEPEAWRLLTEGFAGEMLSALPVPELAETLRADLRRRLEELRR